MNSTLPSSSWDRLWALRENQFFVRGPSYFHKARILNNLMRSFAKGETLLDVACGTGDYFPVLERYYPTITGVDGSASALRTIKQRYPQHSFRQVDIETERWGGAQFDAATCLNALEEMRNPRGVLEKIALALKKEGLLFLVVPHRKDLWNEKDSFAGNHQRFERQELNQLLEDTGFYEIRTYTWGAFLYRLWYRGMKNVPQEKVWAKKSTSWVSILVGRVASWLLYLDDLLGNNDQGAVLFAVAKKR